MIGHPKYNLRNKVRFQFNGETKEGRVVVVDNMVLLWINLMYHMILW